MSPDAAELALATLEAFNKRDFDAMLSLLAPTATWYDPAMPSPPGKGHAAIRSWCETVIEAFPDFTYEVREPICVSRDGSRCALPWRITATATGWMRPPGFAPTGRQVSFEGVDVVDAAEGKVTHIETHFDLFAGAEQLLDIVVRPKAGSIRERLMVGAQRMRAAWLRSRPGPEHPPVHH